MQQVEDSYREAGIVVPFISNDGFDYGNFAPGTGLGQVDIYGHDSYPLGFNCRNPYVWSGGSNQYFPGESVPSGQPSNYTYFYLMHEAESPSTPYTITEVGLVLG